MLQREDALTRRIQLLCALCGPTMIVVAFIGWFLSGVLPLPLGAHNMPEEVVAFYRDHSMVCVLASSSPASASVVFFRLWP